MSTTSTSRWHVLVRHKIAALVVAVAAVAALTIVLVVTLGSEPAASQPGPTQTVQRHVAPTSHFDCHPRIVVSFC